MKSKANSQAKSNVNCYYCGQSVNIQNSFVIGLGQEFVQSYQDFLFKVRAGRSAGMSESDIKQYVASIKLGKYFCSRQCVRRTGLPIWE